jgi:hypothetical protein
MLKPEVIIPKAAERFDGDGRLVDQSTRELVRAFVEAFGRWTRRMLVPLVLVAITTLSACSGVQLRSPIAPASGPPPSFVATTSDTRVTRLIDVRDGMTKQALFRAATDLLTQKYSIDVSDSHAGFLMTLWQNSYVRGGTPDLRYRTRIIIRFLGDDWKQVSVRAEANWQRGDEWQIGFDSKMLDEVTNDLRSKLGKES